MAAVDYFDTTIHPFHGTSRQNQIMFLPSQVETRQKKARELKEAYKRIDTWVIQQIPGQLRDNAIVNVQEVQCGDPNCAP